MLILSVFSTEYESVALTIELSVHLIHVIKF